jgi:hypothetical protein
MGCTIRHGEIVEIEILADPERLSQLDLALVEDLRSERLSNGARGGPVAPTILVAG